MPDGRSWDLNEPEGADTPPEPAIPAPSPSPVVSWDEISPETLRASALEEDDEVVSGRADAEGAGMAWFEVILGALLGIAAMIGGWYWSGGGLGFFVALAPVIIGGPMVLSKRRDLKYLGYGLLAAIPIAAVLGLVLWYATLFI